MTTNGPIRANNEYDGEEYDARMEMPGWDKAGFNDSTWDKVQLVQAPGGAIVAQMAEPMRMTEKLKPVAISNPQPGIYIFDMGQNMVGWCRLKVRGPTGIRGYPATLEIGHNLLGEKAFKEKLFMADCFH